MRTVTRINRLFALVLAASAAGVSCAPHKPRLATRYTPPAGADESDPMAAFTQETCDELCAPLTRGKNNACSREDDPEPDGSIIIYCDVPFTGGAGRRPEGFSPPTELDGSLGAWLARTAELEAASVHAFATLARELRELGAPEPLRRRARAAARDEVAHAATMRRLAERAGRRATALGPPPPRQRAPAEIAVENAVEGCVNETFAALVARVCASRATDVEVASAFRQIAADEARHAALAHDVRAFLGARMTTSERSVVEAAHRQALAALPSSATQFELDLLERARVGLPSGEELRDLAKRLAAELLRVNPTNESPTRSPADRRS